MHNTIRNDYRGWVNLAAFLLTVALLTAATTITTFAQQPGALDRTFSGDGKQIETSIPGGGGDYGRSVLIQPDGKILIVGSSNYGPKTACSATRYFADGTLDPAFGSSGKVLMDPTLPMACNSAAIQADGKIVAAGSSNGDFVLVRYNTDGSLDTTFDGDGKVTTDLGYDDRANAIAIQSDGKLVATGSSSGDFALVRYNTDGSLDATFDGDGKVTTDIAYDDGANAVAAQPDGKLVAAGYISCEPCEYSAFALARYNGDGSLDTAFDGDGKVIVEFAGYYAVGKANAVAIQPDGRIVVAGSGQWHFALARHNSDGSLDETFGAGGTMTTSIGAFDEANAVAIQPDGKIVAAGHSTNFGPSDFALVRYNTNGSLDVTFDGDGKVTTNIDCEDHATAVALQPDGKILVAGYSLRFSTSRDFALIRYHVTGLLDASGFNGGVVLTDIGRSSLTGGAIAVQPDGRIVVVGRSYNNGDATTQFALVRYNPDGTLDTTFDGDGSVTTYIGGCNLHNAGAVAIQSDGKIVAAGHGCNGGTGYPEFALVRYNIDGSLDTTFDGDGKVTTQISTSFDTANAVAIQPDGKIVAAGYGHTGSIFEFVLVRYNADGSLDTTFDGDGTVTTSITGNDYAFAVALQPDGKIVAAGINALVRYNPNGSLDTTFDGDGKVPTDLADYDAYAVALQPDGKLVAAGYSAAGSTPGSSVFFTLVRYNADGSLDATFDGDGKVTTPIGLISTAHAVAIQPDGRIVAAGTGRNGSNPDFALVRYNPNGSLDTTFGGGDGVSTVDFINTGDNAYGMALDNQGRAVVVGTQSEATLAIARFLLEPGRTPFDFDGDGKSDISVFRPSDSVWYLNRSNQGFGAVQFGLPTDKIVPADYDGDGTTDVAVFRSGTWWRINSSNSTVEQVHFGILGDIPVPSDYNGDGRDEVAVYRNGEWWSEGVGRTDFGLPTDKPVPADYDGDGRTDIAIYRDGAWWRINSSSGAVEVVQFGIATDRPVVGDYDGDGRADLAVYRAGSWYLQQSTSGFSAFQWGLATDIPVPADYDGDGKTDAAVFRDGVWYALRSNAGVLIQHFGLSGDQPAPAAYLQ